MSDVTCQAIIKQCKDFIAEPKENYLLDSFSKGIASVKGVSEEERAEYIRQNEAAVSECVIPAYQSLISALEQLKGTGNNEGGLCKLVMLSGVGCRVLVNGEIFHYRASISFLWGFSGAP